MQVFEKIRGIYKGEHKVFASVITAMTVVFLLLWLIGPGNTLIHWAGAAIEVSRQEKQMEIYRQQIEDMDTKIRMMKTDKDTLEKFAREQFGFCAPGEDVYILDE